MPRILNKRTDIDLCETNVTLLSLGEAVKRWTADGQFMMSEVNHSDAYEAKDNNIPRGASSEHISKIDAALAGMDFVKEVKASAPVDVVEPAPASETTPAPQSAPSAE